MKKRNRVNFLLGNYVQLDRIVRVNHAGEFAAVKIYSSQEIFLSDSKASESIKVMKQQEIEHLDFFVNQLRESKVSPTIFLPLWSILCFFLGYLTALHSKECAMLCTSAVEEVINEHYEKQIKMLGECELSGVINKFRLEELEHRDLAMEYDIDSVSGGKFISFFIKAGCKLAIFLSQRI